jgi:hypothetical protein
MLVMPHGIRKNRQTAPFDAATFMLCQLTLRYFFPTHPERISGVHYHYPEQGSQKKMSFLHQLSWNCDLPKKLQENEALK